MEQAGSQTDLSALGGEAGHTTAMGMVGREGHSLVAMSLGKV
jgi:hypothetical protein